MNWNLVLDEYSREDPHPEDGESVLCEIEHREGTYYLVLSYNKFEDAHDEPAFLDGNTPIEGVVAWSRIEERK